MRKRHFTPFVVFAVGFACLGLFLGTASGQKKAEKKRAATTKQLMKGLVSKNCGDLGNALKAEKTDWDTIALHAALLNESGHLLMDDKRCPSAEWANGTKTLRECSVVVLKKVDAKDLDGAKSAFAALTGGCKTCHEKHKGK